ncbi:MAG: cobalamin biosynthesis protein [Burkholderiales bacterium]|nr:cobalamin biosynthesis protein [Burkholderiales bacterium]
MSADYRLACVMLAAALLDRIFGEPARFHPLAGLGKLISMVEGRIYGDSRMRGILALLFLAIPLCMAVFWLDSILGQAFSAILLYFAIAPRSLAEHARQVADALDLGKIDEARIAVGKMVSRETGNLDEAGVSVAAVESVLENGSDAIFSALFWFALLGAPGVMLYRLANTLDAMWGYRNARYLRFGWAAARLDDLLNFVPARLTALSYALFGNFASALRCWKLQARAWESPNAGPVMASGAGALQIELGGAAVYEGVIHDRPVLGAGKRASSRDIHRAIGLVEQSLLFWLAVPFLVAFLRSAHA